MSRAFRLPHLLCLLGLGACTSILGIEDLHEESRPGGEENVAGNSNGDAGKTNGNGGKTNGNGGTSNPGGGMAEPEAGAGNDSSGGSGGNINEGGSGGNVNEGGGGEGGAAEPVRGKVTGKVVDRFGVPVGSTPVQIAESLVSTDDQGVFTVEDVPSTYDVSLLVQGDGWVFQGLTRRDPTLQVFRGHPGHYTYVTVTSANATLGTNDQLTLGAGMPTGTSDEYTDIGIDSPVSYSLEWDGGISTASTVHGLEWTQDATTKLPATYKAYDSKPLALMANVNAALSLNMVPKSISTGVVTGTVAPRVTPIGDGSRTNSVFVRFGSGASIQVAAHKAPAEAFSYVVPTLADSSITVAAWEGEYLGPLGMVHKDKLSPGTPTGSLVIPAPPKLLKPLAGSIDATTPFSFQGSPDNAGAFLVILNSLDTGSHLYIVTAQQKLSHLPNVVDGAWTLEHASGAAQPVEYQWWVETHGSFATVDAMTGPDGFIDEFGVNYDTPVGIHHRDGTYTYSSYSIVTTKNE